MLFPEGEMMLLAVVAYGWESEAFYRKWWGREIK